MPRRAFKNAPKLLETTLNVSSLVALAWVAFLFISRYSGHPQPDGGLGVGKRLSVANVDWRSEQSSLVFFLSVSCHWCKQSAPFYRALLSSVPHNVRTVALLPGPMDQSRHYLDSEGLRIKEVAEANFGQLGVTGTPALALVNSTGRIEASWSGFLSENEEAEVYRALGQNPVRHQNKAVQANVDPKEEALISSKELSALLANHAVVPIIDVRSRSKFSQSHISGAFNIPIDELETRANHEVPTWPTVIIYCHYCSACEALNSRQRSWTACTFPLHIMKEHGFTQAKLLADNLAGARTSGISVWGDPGDN